MNTFVCATVMCCGILSAKAALIYDPFDYLVGADLTGQSPNGGINSWQVMGTGGTGGTDPILIEAGSLSVPGLAPSTGNSITYGGLGLTNRIPLGVTITSGTLYYSFAFKITDLGSLSATGGFMAGFNNATGNVANQPTAIATRLVTKLNGTGFQVGVDKTLGQAGSFVFAETVFNPGDTVFVVGSYTFNSGSTTDDESKLWVNPDPATFGLEIPPAGALSSFSTADFTQIASFLFRQGNASAVPGVVVADELRVDTTWAGVTVPEPSSVGWLGLAGAGLMARRGRSRP
jgi:hypothetical protein